MVHRKIVVGLVAAGVVASGTAIAAGVPRIRPVPSGSTRVTVAADATTSGIDFALVPGAGVAGRVTLPGGAPAAYELVRVYLPGGGLREARTDSTGHFRVLGLPFGSAGVRICADTGKFVGRCWGSGGPWLGGLFRQTFDRPPYHLAFPPGTKAIPLTSGAIRRGIDLKLARAATLTGTIQRRDGSAVDSSLITLFTASGQRVSSRGRQSGTRYRFIRIPAGDYIVCSSSASLGDSRYAGVCSGNVVWSDEAAIPANAVPVHVAPHTVTSARPLVAQTGGTITGTVHRPEQPKHPLGYRPFVDVFRNGKLWTISRSIRGHTDPTVFHYRLQGLPAGKYVVCAQNNDNGLNGFLNRYQPGQCWRNVGWSGRGIPRAAADVAVRAGRTRHHVDLRIGRTRWYTGAITGTVTDTSGRPVAGLDVFAAAKTAEAVPDVRLFAVTDNSGSYRITRVPPAPSGYTVCVFPGSGPDDSLYAQTCYGQSPAKPDARSRRVRVAPGQTRQVDITVMHNGTVTGRITFNGAGVTPPEGRQFPGIAFISADRKRLVSGSYPWSISPNGDYSITVAPTAAGYFACFDPRLFPPVQGAPTGFDPQCYRTKNR